MRSTSVAFCLRRLLPIAFLLLSTAAFDNDFSAYPEGARSCLDNSARESACEGDDASTMNACLCSNGGDFVESSAVCIGQQAPADLGAVWDKMSANCLGTSTPLTLSRTEFIDIGEKPDATSSSTATSGPTASATSSPTVSDDSAATASESSEQESDESASKPMSTGGIVGISVACVVAVGCLAAGAFIFLRRRQPGQNRGEYHQMTTQNPSLPPGGPILGGYSDQAIPSPTPVWSVGDTKTPDMTLSPGSMSSGWGGSDSIGYQPSAISGQYPAYGQQQTAYHMPGAQHQQEVIHELPLSPPQQMHMGAVEMPGSFPEQQSTAYRGAGGEFNR